MKVFSVAVLTSVALAMVIPNSPACAISDDSKNTKRMEDNKPQELSSILEAEASASETSSILNRPHLGEDIKSMEIMICGDIESQENDCTNENIELAEIEEKEGTNEDIKPQEYSSLQNPESKEPGPDISHAVGEEAGYIEEISAQLSALDRRISYLNMVLAYGNRFDIKLMAELRAEYQKISTEIRNLGATKEAKKLQDSVEASFTAIRTMHESMKTMCDTKQNQFEYCALFSAAQYSDQAREFKNVFRHLLKEIRSAPAASEDLKSSVLKNFKEEGQKFETFKLLETDHWTSGDKDRALAELKEASNAREKVDFALKEYSFI